MPEQPRKETTVSDEQVDRALAIFRDTSETQGMLPPVLSGDWMETLRNRTRVAMRAVLEDFANG